MTKNIVEFPSHKAIEEEAGTWLIKLDGDSALTAEERVLLREWLERSPAHREQLGSLASLWGRMNVLTELAVPLEHLERSPGRSIFERLRQAVPQAGLAGLAAAVFVIGIGLASTFWLRADSFLASNGLYATAVGQQLSTTLADGSVVILNTNSQYNVDFDDEHRNIYLLQGEAHFTVARDAARPFRVYAGAGRVQAVGTAFSVHLKDNAIDVTVTEGEVMLASITSPTTVQLQQLDTSPGGGNLSASNEIVDIEPVELLGTLKAGEIATIQSVLEDGTAGTVGAIESIETQVMADRLSWREGMLTFAGEPLIVVVDEISRYTAVSIEITDPVVSAMRIGGRFPIGETDAMFDALEANFGLRVTRLSHDRVLVSAAEE